MKPDDITTDWVEINTLFLSFILVIASSKVSQKMPKVLEFL